MSTFCDIALFFGLASGICGADEGISQLPKDDPKAWQVVLPEPEPPAQLPPPAMPPVIIAPPPVQVVAPPPPAPEPVIVKIAPPKPKGPSAEELAAWASIRNSRVQQPMLASAAGTGFDQGHDIAANGTDTPPAFEGASLPAFDQDAIVDPATLAASKYKAPGVEAGKPMDNSRILRADRYIQGVLETSLNSQLDGSVIIQVAWDVYGYHGQTPLVPKGSRLICDYSQPKVGDTRLAIDCKRLLIAETAIELFQLSARGGDVQGRAGVTGELDTRFFDKFGAAFTLAGISAAVRLSTAITGDSNGESDQVSTAFNEGSAELSQQLGEIGATLLDQTIDLEPIVTIPQGTKITIRPDNDLYFRETNS